MAKIFNGKVVIDEQFLKDEEGKKDKEQDELRKQMEWYHKGQTMLTVTDIDRLCTEYGLNK